MSLFLNLALLALTGLFVTWKATTTGFDLGSSGAWSERVISWIALAAFAWLGVGCALPFVTNLV